MRQHGTAAELERRRRLALSNLHNGYSVPEVAEMFQVSERAVYGWQAAFAREGSAGLDAQRPPPRDRKLSRVQERQVLGWFLEDAARIERDVRAMGFDPETGLLNADEITARQTWAGGVVARMWTHLATA